MFPRLNWGQIDEMFAISVVHNINFSESLKGKFPKPFDFYSSSPAAIAPHCLSDLSRPPKCNTIASCINRKRPVGNHPSWVHIIARVSGHLSRLTPIGINNVNIPARSPSRRHKGDPPPIGGPRGVNGLIWGDWSL